MRRLFFSLWYLLRRPPWDTGLTPPELIEIVERHNLPAGRALDLGCGTGTNLLYLAQRGWQAVGVDFARPAIRAARRRLRAAPADVTARIQLHVGDVSQLDWLDPPFDLALDQGCYHSIPARQRPAYAAGLCRLLRSGATYLLYAFKPGTGRAPGVTEAELRTLFAGGLELVRVVEGTSGPPAAWYTLHRR